MKFPVFGALFQPGLCGTIQGIPHVLDQQSLKFQTSLVRRNILWVSFVKLLHTRPNDQKLNRWVETQQNL
jgi:hypothetical protein